MIERLTNCPQCGGTLNEAGRCEFCGSKIFDFLSIDFNVRGMPSAKTYIRVKTNGKVMIAPVVIGTMSMEMARDTIDCIDTYSGTERIRIPVYPTFNVDFRVIGDMIQIDDEGDMSDG